MEVAHIPFHSSSQCCDVSVLMPPEHGLLVHLSKILRKKGGFCCTESVELSEGLCLDLA
eukprot:NODE_531_length_759_cov_109.786392_g522_i0.p2 GENE.NODE_531_length_759_cov_109.786392_g522_i0~~NODE_531_length_759_cov_109.786392_g522_i0.p2  ORF type:complete len:59 (+),score=8.12 NODE_531_length_759_cov_109.786392_g522_i0:100-276(+)